MELSQLADTHLALVDGPYTVVLTTLLPSGQPQSTPVWCNREGDFVLINTMKNFQKYKNMVQNPKVTLLIYDPQKPLHNIEIRGEIIEMAEDHAEEHLDALTRLYHNNPDAVFFGDSVAPEFRTTHIPVKITIQPTRIRVED